MPFDVISSAAMVQRDLPAVWEWFDYRRNLLNQVQANAAHHSIAYWQQRFPQLTVVTQNIDGLHQAAGSTNVIELHGSIWRSRCIDCHSRREIPRDECRESLCYECGSHLRPDVVLFGEMLAPGTFELAVERAAASDLCFVIGTSALVYPAASLPEIAKSSGAFVCEVNPERTPLSDLCDEVITGRAGDVLPLFSK
jgi:NAD-dependent deacetylase